MRAGTRWSAFYSNIDYQLVPSLPDDALYFHAQYRQATPNVAHTESDKNLDGKHNYVYVETRGRGHLMGVTLGVLQNTDHWMGEGDDMIFVDDETKPVITGTGSEDYFNGAWDFGGRDGAVPFAHLYNGAPLMIAPEIAGGRYCLYRWHADNPVNFHPLSQAHHGARARRRPRGQFLFRGLLVPVGAVHRLPDAPAGGGAHSEFESGARTGRRPAGIMTRRDL